jgi:hypothetical protein
MRNSFTAAIVLVLACGCSDEIRVRKEPDLLRVDPKEAQRLRDVRIEPASAARVSERSNWQVHTTLGNRLALSDGDPQTVAASTREHRKGEWVLIDLGCLCRVQNVRQDHPSDGGQPPSYRVDTADETGFPYTLQFVGSGQSGSSVATFPRAVDARFIRITVMDDSAQPWAISELDVY